MQVFSCKFKTRTSARTVEFATDKNLENCIAVQTVALCLLA